MLSHSQPRGHGYRVPSPEIAFLTMAESGFFQPGDWGKHPRLSLPRAVSSWDGVGPLLGMQGVGMAEE